MSKGSSTSDVRRLLKALNREKTLSASLLSQMMPPRIAATLRAGQTVVPEHFENVTVFFSDIVGFTKIASHVNPQEVVTFLNDLYLVMDYCTSKFPLYKVETIGDAYMVVSGAPDEEQDHAVHIANFAVLVQKAVSSLVFSPLDNTPIKLRIGINSGPVVAGVVGNLMPRYCFFGDTVNIASRMESTGESDRIQCSASTAEHLKRKGFHNIVERGLIDVKGKGQMETYWIEGASAANDIISKDDIDRAIKFASTLSPTVYSLATDYRNTNEDLSDCESFTEDAAVDFKTESSSVRFTAESMSPATSFGSEKLTDLAISLLIVEDSTLKRRLLTEALRDTSSNWELNFAENGETAISKLKAANLRYDVVIINLESSFERSRISSIQLVAILKNVLGMDDCIVIGLTQDSKSSQAFLKLGIDEIWDPDMISKRMILDSFDKLRNKNFLAPILKSTSWAMLPSFPEYDDDFLDNSSMSCHKNAVKVLLVEDSVTQSKLMLKRFRDIAMYLGQLWNITVLNDAEKALNELQSGRLHCDLAFIDHHLSSTGKYGSELIADMRTCSHLENCVIIMCTNSIDKYSQSALLAGADSVWPKPLASVGELSQKLKRLNYAVQSSKISGDYYLGYDCATPLDQSQHNQPRSMKDSWY